MLVNRCLYVRRISLFGGVPSVLCFVIKSKDILHHIRYAELCENRSPAARAGSRDIDSSAPQVPLTPIHLWPLHRQQRLFNFFSYPCFLYKTDSSARPFDVLFLCRRPLDNGDPSIPTRTTFGTMNLFLLSTLCTFFVFVSAQEGYIVRFHSSKIAKENRRGWIDNQLRKASLPPLTNSEAASLKVSLVPNVPLCAKTGLP